MTDAFSDEINAAKEKLEEEKHIDPNLTRELVYLSLDEVDFDPKHNVRDPQSNPERVLRKHAELMRDGFIRTPLVVCITPTMPKKALPMGTCGFIRYAALCKIRSENPEFFKQAYEGRIPFTVIRCTDADRERILLDHGSEEQLNIIEVINRQKRLTRSGAYKLREIVDMLSSMYYNLASIKDRTTYDRRLKEFSEKGVVMIGSTACTTIADIRYHTWRGRSQYFGRIINAPEIAYEEFCKHARGEKDSIEITYKGAEALEKMSPEAAADYFAKLREAKATKGTTQGSNTGWGVAKITAARAANKSRYLGLQLDAIMGDKDAALGLVDAEEELVLFEKALDIDKDRVIYFLKEVIAEG